MSKRHKDYKKRRSQYRRLNVQTTAINSMNRLALYVLVVVICVLAHLFAMPEYKKLEEKELALAEVESQRDQAILRKDRVQREARALQEDPEYMELIARDVLEYYKPGEIVFDVNRKKRTSVLP